jgi:hypothetical protein
MPERFSSRSDLRGGREVRVESLKAGVGKEETCKFSSDGRRLHTSANSRESMFPPGLQWRKRVLRCVQFEW